MIVCVVSDGKGITMLEAFCGLFSFAGVGFVLMLLGLKCQGARDVERLDHVYEVIQDVGL